MKKQEMECGICLDPADPAAEEVIRISPCGHYQHKHCQEQWESEEYRAKDCPSCRTPVADKTRVPPPESDSNHDDCSICLAELTDDVIYVVACSHEFHAGCLYQWQDQQNTCPVCRAQIDRSLPRGVPPDEVPAADAPPNTDRGLSEGDPPEGDPPEGDAWENTRLRWVLPRHTHTEEGLLRLVNNDDGSAPFYMVLEAHRLAARNEPEPPREPRRPVVNEILRAVVGLGRAAAEVVAEHRHRREDPQPMNAYVTGFHRANFGQHHFHVGPEINETPAAALNAIAQQEGDRQRTGRRNATTWGRRYADNEPIGFGGYHGDFVYQNSAHAASGL